MKYEEDLSPNYPEPKFSGWRVVAAMCILFALALGMALLTGGI
jgi:hypothetical protein